MLLVLEMPLLKLPALKKLLSLMQFKVFIKKLVLNEDGSRLLGGILIGDASAYGTLLQFVQNNIALPPHPEDFAVTSTRR
jgi:nitrite reductase (NADH) large subunit